MKHPLKNQNSKHYQKIKIDDNLITKLEMLEFLTPLDIYKLSQLKDVLEAIDIIQTVLTKEELICACKFNMLKYTLRDKGDDELDREKIKDYKLFKEWLG